MLPGQMHNLVRKLLLVLALACLAAPAHAQGYSPAAQKVLSRALAASGGSGWLRLRGWHETGRRATGAAYESWIDPLRYGLRVETREAGGVAVHGFNGQADWRIQPTGAVSAVNDHASLAEARTTAFFSAPCYFFPGRYDVRGELRGVRRRGAKAYDVVEVQPWGGGARELWFDQRTHLLARIVDRSGRRSSAVAVSDYRRVGPVLVAFRYTSEPGGPPDPLARQVETLAFTPADRNLFSLAHPAEHPELAAPRSPVAQAITPPAASAPGTDPRT
jgi:hypothetical protein